MSANLELEPTEKERWTAVLSPSPCCTYGCDKSPGCIGGQDKAPCSRYCIKSRQPCATPYSCAPGCFLETKNSDGSDQHLSPPPSLWRRLTNYLKST